MMEPQYDFEKFLGLDKFNLDDSYKMIPIKKTIRTKIIKEGCEITFICMKTMLLV